MLIWWVPRKRVLTGRSMTNLRTSKGVRLTPCAKAPALAKAANDRLNTRPENTPARIGHHLLEQSRKANGTLSHPEPVCRAACAAPGLSFRASAGAAKALGELLSGTANGILEMASAHEVAAHMTIVARQPRSATGKNPQVGRGKYPKPPARKKAPRPHSLNIRFLSGIVPLKATAVLAPPDN